MAWTGSCIIIGAGISGLLAAQRLMRYDIKVTLIEKSRGYGGRMAIKEIEGSTFDIGAQFMTTREIAFRERVESWLAKGEVLPWYIGPLKNMRYVGSKGMTSVPNRIAKSLDVRLSERASQLKFSKNRWTVTTEPYGKKKKNKYEADWLILTAPVPQSLDLLEKSGIELDYDDEEELKKISYLRCLTAMAKLNGPSGFPNPGAMDLNHDVLRWLGDNHMKGISPNVGDVNLHSSPKFAEANWDNPKEEWI